MPTLEQMVEALSRQRSSRDLSMQPGATDRQIDALSAEVRETFGVDLPGRHADLLRMTNGINENSLYVFATKLSRNLSSDVTGRKSIIIGLVEQNKRLRGDYEHFVDVLVFHPTTNTFTFKTSCPANTFCCRRTTRRPMRCSGRTTS